MKKALLIIGFFTLASFNDVRNDVRLTFSFTPSQAQTILKALQKLPYEESADIINLITKEGNRQLDSLKTNK